MEEKENFGKYILKKRKEAGLSQKALADQLFVSESAVSKWERGLSYPDITLVSSLCEALHITEHELITASDDMHQREIEEQSRGYLRIIKTYSWVTYLCYAAALIPTFIWGLTSHNGLSVFFITAAALLLVFSVINVPVLAKHRKTLKMFWASYGSLILLLIVCRLALGGNWLIMSVLGVSLGLLGVFLPIILHTTQSDHPFFRYKGLLCIALDTALVYLLVFFGHLFYVPDWNRGILAENMIITTLCAIWAWLIFLLFRYTRLSIWLKSSVSGILIGIFIFFSDVAEDIILNGSSFYCPAIQFQDWYNHVNANLGITIIVCAAVFTVIVLIRDIVRINK